MASNFKFLAEEKQFESIYAAAITAENSYNFNPKDPDATIMLVRRALEVAVKWMYHYDSALSIPEYVDDVDKATLAILTSHADFRDIVDAKIYKSITFLRKVGNKSAHNSTRRASVKEAEVALENLFQVCDFIYYCYSKQSAYTDNKFDINNIKNIQSFAKVIPNKEISFENITEVEQKSYTENRLAKQPAYEPKSLDLSEYETRKVYIDTMLRDAGWIENDNWKNEYPIENVRGLKSGKGNADYALLNKEGKPIAIIEAKRVGRDELAGIEQARAYAAALKEKYNIQPVIFLSNGYDFKILQDGYYNAREIFGIYSEQDLLRTSYILQHRQPLNNIEINEEITGRYYQIQAIKAVCDDFMKNRRKALLVMATGCGKTRTVISLVDVLNRYGWVRNVLFLTDRIALVKQAFNSLNEFNENHIKMSASNIVSENGSESDIEYNVSFIFSTYQTMRNVLNKSEENPYTTGHFDLIIVDEAHRSIYNKYKDIFKYFDSMLIGLTATPKNEIERNTYEIFDLEHKMPTYGYELEQAVKDGFLVSYKLDNSKLDILNRGIHYNELSDEEKQEYEKMFADEDGKIPDSIAEKEINSKIYNKDTIKKALHILMTNGLYIDDGNTLGKTIIFARNHRHAKLIFEVFNTTYPHLLNYCVIIDNQIERASDILFKFVEKNSKTPRIAISVDMMDTGVDIPDCLNLVFFKPVKTYSKFIQMIGRGTRLCPQLINGEDKKYFLIFDLCGNFEYFGEEEHRQEKGNVSKSIMERLFNIKLDICLLMQGRSEHEHIYIPLKNQLENIIKSLPRNDIAVKQNIKIIDRYSQINALNNISRQDINNINNNISPLVPPIQDDIKSLQLDELIYNIIYNKLQNINALTFLKQLKYIASKLLEIKVPEIMKNKVLLNDIISNAVNMNTSVADFENIRKILRELVKNLSKNFKEIFYTNFEDRIIIGEVREDEPVITTQYLENYKKRIKIALEKRISSETVLNKLYTNRKLTKADIRALEKILWQDLSSEQEYRQIAGQIPVAEFILSLIGVEKNIVLDRFAKYINKSKYNSNQIEFIYLVIENIHHNGFIKDRMILSKPPFSNYGGIMNLFPEDEAYEIANIINSFSISD